MALTLRVVSVDGRAIDRPLSGRFDVGVGTIGRADTNTLALPDPERRISRKQVEVCAEENGYTLRNVGSGNAVTVGDRVVESGMATALRAGDVLRVGGYLLQVEADVATTDEATTFDVEFARPAEKRAPAPPAVASSVAASNPFADLLAAPTPAAASRAPSSEAAPGRLPDDFDPFAAPAPVAAPAAAPRPAAGLFDDLIGASPTPSADQFFGLATASSADPLADFLADAQPGSARAGSTVEASSTDPLALFGGVADSRPAPQTAPDRTPELHGSFTPPRPIAKPRPQAAAAAPAPRVAETAPAQPAISFGWTPDAIAVWNALCEGAGVRLAPPPNTGPQFMRVVGMIMRAAVEGTVQLMAVRHATRQELHAQVTQIQPKNNNPLKFAPDGLSALEQLLQPAVRGFLPGPAAMTDAMNDLLGHAIGTMAGTRAALEGVLGRFAPEQLEAKLSGKSVLDNLVPAARKAKLWDLYLLHYEALRDEAQEDFHALFGKAFLAAYEQQLDRLKREKAAAAARGAPSR